MSKLRTMQQFLAAAACDLSEASKNQPNEASIKFEELSAEATKMGALTEDMKQRFGSLTDAVTPTMKIRYLIMHAFEHREHNHGIIYKRWLALLSKHGISRETVDAVIHGHNSFITDQHKRVSSISTSSGYHLVENHISALTEVIANVSHKWQEIASSESINLPENIRSDIYMTMVISRNSRICLSLVLREWIVGGHEYAKPPTLENLKKALNSKMVGLGKEANLIQLPDNPGQLGVPEQPGSESEYAGAADDSTFVIVYQSHTEEKVNEGMSAMLEVQIIVLHECAVSYQWTINGCPLIDGKQYLGANKPILCISNATSLTTKGTYVCEVQAITESGHCSVKHSKGTRLAIQVHTSRATLIDLYSLLPEVLKDTWPPESCKHFVNLALVDNIIMKEEKKHKSAWLTSKGDADDVVATKGSMEYESAFGEFRSGFTLIEGRPGSGKTSLVNKIAKDWASDKPILQGAKYLFLVTLRLLPKENLKIQDILELFYSKDSDIQVMESLIETSKGEGVCFMLDGLDEYVSEEQGKNSIIYQLIHRKYLPLAMIVVASRPVATSNLRNKHNCRCIEVVGFLEKQVLEYIDHYPFTKHNSGKKLKLYLQQHPNILDLCYLPVHIGMISFLHERMGSDLPITETGIYKHFARLTLLRNIRRFNSDALLDSLEALSGENKAFFDRVCELAFKMTASEKQVFQMGELGDCTGSDNLFLGFVSVESISGRGASGTGLPNFYSFVHLTFQEFLAAYHMSHLSHEDQTMMLFEYTLTKKHMQVVWKFFCGLVNFDELDDQAIQFEDILKIKSFDNVFHCQCSFESQQPSTSMFIRENGCLSFKYDILSPSDFHALSFVISNSDGALKKLKLTNCIISNAKSLADVLKICNKLLYLDLSGSHIDGRDAQLLATGLRNCTSLLTLNLSDNKIGDDGAEALNVLKYCSSLESLDLECNEMSSKGIECLCGTLQECYNLKVLNLSDNNATSIGARAFTEGLKNCTKLRTLHLAANGIFGEGIVSLAKGITHCTELKSLHLDYNNISDSSAQVFSDCLKCCTKLKIITLRDCEISDNGAIAIAACLGDLDKLASLNLKSNHIGCIGTVALAVNFNGSALQNLNLKDNKIGDEGAEALAQSCSSLKKLNLSDNKIGDAGIKSLADCIDLGALKLEGNHIRY